MKSALLPLAASLLFSCCTSLEFEMPLPNEGLEVKSLPRNLVGIYQDAKDSSTLLKQYKRIEFIPKDASWEFRTQYFLFAAELDTSKEAFIRNDSLFGAATDSSGPNFATKVRRIGDRYVADAKLRYRVEPNKGTLTIYNEDTGAPSLHKLVLRKQGDSYFFNLQEPGSKYWQATALRQTPQGLQLQYLSDPQKDKQDLPFATKIQVDKTELGALDTTLVANPTDRELEAYRSNPALVNTENLIRVEHK